jgi:hypothetical protein
MANKSGYNSIRYWRLIFPILLIICIVSVILIVIYYPATTDLLSIKMMQQMPGIQTFNSINSAASALSR